VVRGQVRVHGEVPLARDVAGADTFEIRRRTMPLCQS
jgi:hypothetical protein